MYIYTYIYTYIYVCIHRANPKALPTVDLGSTRRSYTPSLFTPADKVFTAGSKGAGPVRAFSLAFRISLTRARPSIFVKVDSG